MDDLGEGEAGPSAPKYRNKAQEAAPYKTKFNPAWAKELPFIGPVTGDLYRYMLAS